MRVLLTSLLVLFLISCKKEIKTVVSKPEVPVKVTEEKAPEEVELKEISFLEFFETFMSDMEYQKSRVDFPVFMMKEKVKSNDWMAIDFLQHAEFYPYLLQDTLKPKQVEKQLVHIIDFNQNIYTDYHFLRSLDQWKLTKIESSELDSLNENEFVGFLIRFSLDADFQRAHIAFPLKEVTMEIDSLTTFKASQIPVEEWEFFDFISEIQYLIIFNQQPLNPNTQYIELRGNENGISVTYTFQKINGEWMFVQIDDQST